MIRRLPISTLFPYTTLFRSIGIISEESKRDYVMQLGAKGVVNRKEFSCWGQMPEVGTPEYDNWVKEARRLDRKSTRLNSSHPSISYAVFCLKKKNNQSTKLS